MTKHARITASLCLSLATFVVNAAPPDAGSLLRQELQREQLPLPTTPPKEAPREAVQPATTGSIKFVVTAFQISGLSAIPEAEAQTFLATYLGQTLTLEGLHQVAGQFERWLRSRGLFVARAYIPPQQIEQGVVKIRVLEGRLEGIEIKRTPETRLPEETLRDTLSGALPPGTAMEQTRLERGLLLLNDLPATSARAVLSPGTEVGGSRIVVEAAQGPVLASNVELDNTGNRFTGERRLGAGLSINDPYGYGDQWSVRAITSQGSTFARLGYTRPVGINGAKIGATWITSHYQLCCDTAVSALDASGKAGALFGFFTYPFLRTRLANLAGSASWSERSFLNRQLGQTTSDKKSRTLTLGIQGDVSNLGGADTYTAYAAQWITGRLDLSGSPDQAQDASTAQSNGSFNKWTGQLSHLIRLNNQDAIYAGLSAQLAEKNLDSSEKFVLGGPQGVRAYPTGEAVGDAGWLLNLEWRRELSQKWRTTVFADYGEVRLHQNPWSNWNSTTPTLGNRYALAGLGASLVWTPSQNTQITSTLATRLGSNPARDTSGRDSDNRLDTMRLWLQGNLSF